MRHYAGLALTIDVGPESCSDLRGADVQRVWPKSCKGVSFDNSMPREVGQKHLVRTPPSTSLRGWLSGLGIAHVLSPIALATGCTTLHDFLESVSNDAQLQRLCELADLTVVEGQKLQGGMAALRART